MCYNCGCEIPEDDMGKGSVGVDASGKAITDQTFKVVAEAFGTTEEEAKKNTLTLLGKVLGEKPTERGESEDEIPELTDEEELAE